MNKRTIFSCLVLLTGAAFLQAEQCEPSEMEKKQLCSTLTKTECGHGIYFDIGLIAEQMRVSGTEVSILNTSEITDLEGGGTGAVYTDRIADINFDLDVGLRIALGHELEHDDWMAVAAFEWLSSTGKVSQNASGSGLIFPYNVTAPFSNGTQVTFSAAAAALKVDYYLLDIMLGKGVFFSKNFSFKPFAGLKASWIGYKGNSGFTTVADEDVPAGAVWKSNSQVDFWGVGPMIGLDGNYFVVAGWSIYSSANASVLLGEANVSNYIRLVPTGDGGYQPENAYINQTVLCPTLRATLGLQYDTKGFNDDQSAALRFGFDGRYYFNQYPTLGYRGYAVSPAAEAGQLDYNPLITNNAFGMIGLIVDLGWFF